MLLMFLPLVSNYNLDLSNCRCSRGFCTRFLFQHSLNKVIPLINVWLYCNPDCDLWCPKAHYSKLGRVGYVETQWRFVFTYTVTSKVIWYLYTVCSNVCDSVLFMCVLVNQNHCMFRQSPWAENYLRPHVCVLNLWYYWTIFKTEI